MSYFIRIERIPYEEPYHLQLVWEASNGDITSCFEFYVNADALAQIGEALIAFPRHASDVFLFEVGSEKPEDRFAYYFRFRAFTTDSRGHCAIQIRYNNNRDLPYREVVEFCIKAEAASINRLGTLFKGFAKLETEYLSWSETEQYLGGKYDNA